MNMRKILITTCAGIIPLICTLIVNAQAISLPPAVSIRILSQNTLSGVAGDFVTVQGQITNTGTTTLTDITTYLSLVDTGTKLPVDLEDWSAEKGLYIGSINAKQTLPLSWKIHFVKSGTYSLIIVAEAGSSEVPQVSTITHFNVAPKKNLNPGQVLPVALGTPIILLVILFLLSYRRKVNE
jgi:hypothetical protein